MRSLAVLTLAVLVAGAAARADDKPEGRAKSAAETFLKALKSKDVPAMVKAADVPFLLPDIKAKKEPKLVRVEKQDALAAALKPLIELKGKGLPTAIGEVRSLADFKKEIGDGPKAKAPEVKSVLEVGGDNGFAVLLVDDKKEQAGILLVRVKGESAKVVGILPVGRAAPAKKE
jgi:hypothetical protein